MFFRDCGDHGISIEFKKYYGIQFQASSLLYDLEEARDNAYFEVERLVLERFADMKNKNYRLESITSKYIQQEQVKQKQKQLTEIVHKD